ncbi:RHS repeat-associated core domain-containing protein [Sorangium sp. So ce341]|uniref:RHS repeat-associated core domain-containing protein n=1 Tax=Sorangium sp. So ce341 TaxID=3133302 RepID=UPI003F604B84
MTAMARTAPVPNIPAIPGMNPGVWIMGGGGAGGGGNGRGGNGQADGQGAHGQSGGNEANGGGKNASGCGQGKGAGCSNPVHGGGGGAAAGDPVDIVTGRVYTEPVVDLALPGPLPLIITRAYSSTARSRDVGLGFGWTHSLAWEVEVRRRSVRVWRPEGTFLSSRRLEAGDSTVLEDGALLLHDATGYTLITSDGRRHEFPGTPNPGQRLLLSRIIDRNGNAIKLNYRDGVLESIIDSVQRVVRVRRHQGGRIAAFEVKNSPSQGRWIAYRTYTFDTAGDLVCATDAEGHASRFSYSEHLMTSHTYPAGLRVVYRYDAQGRCVETWGEHPGARDPSLADDVPAFLADRTTEARGVHHCKLEYGGDGYTEVVDSRQVRRYFGNGLGKIDKAAWGVGVHTSSYDQYGNLLAYTNALGSNWRWERDAQGNIVRAVDPMGATTEYRYDEAGNLAEIIDPHGCWTRYEHDARGNLLAVHDASGDVIRCTYDDRGLLVEATLPNGGVTRIHRDAHGNPTEIVEPSGASKRIRYDYLGCVHAMTDERGHERRYVYSARREVVAVHLPDGGQYSFAYDADGRIERLTDPVGRVHELRWAGLGAVHELRKPDGSRIRYRYDREGALTLVINEKGESHRIVRNSAGWIVEEQTFDGRHVRYQMDVAGRISLIESDSRDKTEFVYDACGRIVERIYSDATKDSFAYDACGRMISASSNAVECEFTYDDRGRMTRETQIFGGATNVVSSAYDALGKRRMKVTSLGYREAVEHDAMGQPVRLLLGGVDPIEFRWDAQGFEIERVLPGGGAVQTKVDPLGRVERRRVIKQSGGPTVGPGQPEWVGPLPLKITSECAYRYSAAGDLLEEWDLSKGRVIYTYDPAGQILSKLPEQARAEVYAYDEAGNLFEQGAGAEPRTYELGGKLVRRGRSELLYDCDGRLVERRVIESDGQRRVWRYHWDARGLLSNVVKPDGQSVDFVYDPFARRVAKRTVASDGLVSLTRFVWDGDVLVHELHESAGATGDPVVEQRTYCFRPGTVFPLAHVDAIPDGSRSLAAEWVHYVNDRTERPTALVRGDGEVLTRLDTRVWGGVEQQESALATTPLRYPGQYEDEEIGLCYNRYRYYDAESGRYISADPIGLQGGLRPFGYANNEPLLVVDPDGLDPVLSTVSGSSGSFTRGSQESPAEIGGGTNPDLHDIVKQSLPPKVNGKYPGGPDPTSCAEPRALTAYIKKWEKDNRDGKPLDPNNPQDHADIRKCLGSITSISAHNPANGSQEAVDRAPCPNCSQLLANLHSKWGGPRPDTIQEGYPALTGKKGAKRGIGERTNFSSPKDPNWLKDPLPEGVGYQRHENYGRPV